MDTDIDQTDYKDFLILAKKLRLKSRKQLCIDPVNVSIENADTILNNKLNVIEVLDHFFVREEFDIFSKLIAHVPINRLRESRSNIFELKTIINCINYLNDIDNNIKSNLTTYINCIVYRYLRNDLKYVDIIFDSIEKYAIMFDEDVIKKISNKTLYHMISLISDALYNNIKLSLDMELIIKKYYKIDHYLAIQFYRKYMDILKITPENLAIKLLKYADTNEKMSLLLEIVDRPFIINLNFHDDTFFSLYNLKNPNLLIEMIISGDAVVDPIELFCPTNASINSLYTYSAYLLSIDDRLYLSLFKSLLSDIDSDSSIKQKIIYVTEYMHKNGFTLELKKDHFDTMTNFHSLFEFLIDSNFNKYISFDVNIITENINYIRDVILIDRIYSFFKHNNMSVQISIFTDYCNMFEHAYNKITDSIHNDLIDRTKYIVEHQDIFVIDQADKIGHDIYRLFMLFDYGEYSVLKSYLDYIYSMGFKIDFNNKLYYEKIQQYTSISKNESVLKFLRWQSSIDAEYRISTKLFDKTFNRILNDIKQYDPNTDDESIDEIINNTTDLELKNKYMDQIKILRREKYLLNKFQHLVYFD